jgi:hypothetical protein
LAFVTDQLFGDWTLSMRPNGISIQKGIEAWINHRGLKPKQIIVIGDGDNNIEILEFTDLAISETVGHDSVKVVADKITNAPEVGGWAAILDLIWQSAKTRHDGRKKAVRHQKSAVRVPLTNGVRGYAQNIPERRDLTPALHRWSDAQLPETFGFVVVAEHGLELLCTAVICLGIIPSVTGVQHP